MKIKTTNQMVNFIKKNIKVKEIKTIYLKKVNYGLYKYLTSIYSDDNLDYDYTTNQYKIIAVEYQDNCYACNKYLTTTDLINFYKASNKTVDGFIAEIKANIEI